jgi:hypothetical protein
MIDVPLRQFHGAWRSDRSVLQPYKHICDFTRGSDPNLACSKDLKAKDGVRAIW